MHTANLQNRLASAIGANIFATKVDSEGRIQLKLLGNYGELRHRYNQMACLIASWIMETLQGPGFGSVGVEQGYGQWSHPLLKDLPMSPLMLLQLAAQGPSDIADAVGFLVSCDNWPKGAYAVARTSAMRKSMMDVGNIFYHFTTHPTVIVGDAHARSAQLRCQEGIQRARLMGYPPEAEGTLMAFMDTLNNSRALHLVHDVQF